MATNISKDDLAVFMMSYPDIVLHHPDLIDNLYTYLLTKDQFRIPEDLKRESLKEYSKVKKLGESYQQLQSDSQE